MPVLAMETRSERSASMSPLSMHAVCAMGMSVNSTKPNRALYVGSLHRVPPPPPTKNTHACQRLSKTGARLVLKVEKCKKT